MNHKVIPTDRERVLEIECEVLRRRLKQAVTRLTELKQHALVREIMGKPTIRLPKGRGPNERRNENV